jgi:hypothetical protein
MRTTSAKWAHSPTATRLAASKGLSRYLAGAHRPPRIGAQVVEVVGIFVAAGNSQHAGAQGCRRHCASPAADCACQVIRGASLSAIPKVFSNAASKITPPSEVTRPPSNAAETFLRSTAGKLNGSRVSSSMAGVAASDSVDLASTPKSLLQSNAYATSANESLPCAE